MAKHSNTLQRKLTAVQIYDSYANKNLPSVVKINLREYNDIVAYLAENRKDQDLIYGPQDGILLFGREFLPIVIEDTDG